jgi:hypothetical protein
LKLGRIYALADPANVWSHRVMERVGMSYDKTEYYKDDLYEGDLIYYVISRDEYRPDGSPYRLLAAAGDDLRTRFMDKLKQRQKERKHGT